MNNIKKYVESAFHFFEELLGLHAPHPKDSILESGEFTVSGSGSVDIPLHHKPHKFFAHITGECHDPIPCNPQESDSIEYYIIEEYDMHSMHKTKHLLHINYQIHSGSRIIKWSVG